MLQQDPVGSYVYPKWGRTCHVTVFVMRVTEVHEAWPEKSVRQLVWVSAAEAVDRVEDPGLKEIIKAAAQAGKR